MLYEVLMYLKNFFIEETHQGVFRIDGGKISLSGIKEGQYFLIEGSTFNDGVYCYPALLRKDEEFRGYISYLAIPTEVIEISEEISKYNSEQVVSPYISESFGGYTYTKASTASGASVGWQGAFAPRLKCWRKL